MVTKLRHKFAVAGAGITAGAVAAYTFASGASADPGDGTADDVTGDEIGEMDDVVKDVVLEQAPNVWIFAGFAIGVLLGLGLAVMVIRNVIGRFRRIGSAG